MKTIYDLVTSISILAPTRGATRFQTLTRLKKISDFNPRSHEGSDHVVGIPAKAVWDFNPRSHEGSDADWNKS